MIEKFKRFEQNGWELKTTTLKNGYETTLVNGNRSIFIQLDKGLGNRKTTTLKEVENKLKAYDLYDNDKEKVKEIESLDAIDYVNLTGVEKELASIIVKSEL